VLGCFWASSLILILMLLRALFLVNLELKDIDMPQFFGFSCLIPLKAFFFPFLLICCLIKLFLFSWGFLLLGNQPTNDCLCPTLLQSIITFYMLQIEWENFTLKLSLFFIVWPWKFFLNIFSALSVIISSYVLFSQHYLINLNHSIWEHHHDNPSFYKTDDYTFYLSPYFPLWFSIFHIALVFDD